MNATRMELREEELNRVTGAEEYNLTAAQCNTIFGFVSSALVKLLYMLNKSYNYTDVGANFMSLMYEYAECYFGVNGKSLNDPIAKAAETVMRRNDIDPEEVKNILDDGAKDYFNN